jgi:hypothetical protein
MKVFLSARQGSYFCKLTINFVADLAEFIRMILLNGVDANYQVAPETTLLDVRTKT